MSNEMPGKDIKNSNMPADKLINNQHIFLSDLAKESSKDDINLVAKMLSRILISTELNEEAKIERAVEIAQNYLSALVRNELVINFPYVIEGLVMQLTQQGISQTVTERFKDKISAEYSLKNHLQEAVNNCARSISEQDSSRIDTRFFDDVIINSDCKSDVKQQKRFNKIIEIFGNGWLTPKGLLGSIEDSFRKQNILSNNQHAREAIIFLLGDHEYGLECQLLAVITDMFYKIGMGTNIERGLIRMNISTKDPKYIGIEYSGSFKLFGFYENIEARKQYKGNFRVILNLIPKDDGFTIKMCNFEYDLGVPELEGKMQFYLPEFPITSNLLSFPQEQQPDEHENNNSSLKSPETRQEEFSVIEPKNADEFLKTAMEMCNRLSQRGMDSGMIEVVKFFQKLELFFRKYSYLLSYEQIQDLRNKNSDFHLRKMANAYYLSNYFIERSKHVKSEDVKLLIDNMMNAFEDAKEKLTRAEKLVGSFEQVRTNIDKASKKIKTEELMLKNHVKNGEMIEKKLEKFKAWENAYTEFKQICNEYELSGEQRQKLLLGTQKDLFNILERHQNQLIKRWKEARSNMEKLSRQINKVSRSLKSTDVPQKDELIKLRENVKNTCNEKNIITGRIRRAWELFKSSPIGRLFGLKTNEQMELEKIRPMQIVDLHTFEQPIRIIESHVFEQSAIQQQFGTYKQVASSLGEIVPKILGLDYDSEPSDDENAEELVETAKALKQLNGSVKRKGKLPEMNQNSTTYPITCGNGNNL